MASNTTSIKYQFLPSLPPQNRQTNPETHTEMQKELEEIKTGEDTHFQLKLTVSYNN